MASPRYRIDWRTPDAALAAIEPTGDEVAACAARLAAAYNDPHNRVMMGHPEDFTAADVVENFADMEASGARQLLLYRSGALAGDADFRSVDLGCAEFAIMVAATSEQRKGLGTRFAIMAHAFGFRTLGLERVYVTMVPDNLGSRRLFERLGYRLDSSAQARSYIDDETDLSLSIDRAGFERAHAEALAQIAVAARGTPVG